MSLASHSETGECRRGASRRQPRRRSWALAGRGSRARGRTAGADGPKLAFHGRNLHCGTSCPTDVYIFCLMSLDRERILRAAAEFLGRRPDATQDEVAAAINVSRATLHRYFAGRAPLLEALDQLAISQMREALKSSRWQEGSAAEALRRLVTACYPVSGYLRLLSIRSEDFDDDQLKAGWAEIDAELKQLFLRGQRSGEFRHDLTAVWLNQAFYSLVSGAGSSVNTGRTARSDFSYLIVEPLLSGIRRA